METKRKLLNHFLAALAYRTQKALRDAPADFGSFRVMEGVRTPSELVRHMTSVLGYARTHFIGGRYRPEPLDSLAAEVKRFHEMLGTLAQHLRNGDALLDGMSEERLLQTFLRCDDTCRTTRAAASSSRRARAAGEFHRR
jgi:hypothetical protein